MIRTSYPASNNGVEIAKIPSGAVASMLENDATKNTILFDDFTDALPGPGGKTIGSLTSYVMNMTNLSTDCKKFKTCSRLARPENGSLLALAEAVCWTQSPSSAEVGNESE